MTYADQKRQEVESELQSELARVDLLAFIEYCWWHNRETQPFIIGRHTREVAAEITEAVERFKRGECTYLDIEIAYRHGKSDLSSVATPAFIAGALNEYQPDVMMLAHSQTLANEFSKKVKAVMSSPEYREIFPDTDIEAGRDSIDSWGVSGSTGAFTFAGLGGSYIGKGASVLIVDDYCAGKDEARSEAWRKKRWEGFTDAMSRLAPVHIVLLVATSWHIDDVRARMKHEEKTNPDFPKFRHLSYPARNKDGTWLFPERFSDAWYRAAYATQQRWASALLDCNPVLDGGNRFVVDGIKIHDSLADFPQGRYVRAWDLASSSKERDSDDPDETVGLLGLITTDFQDIGGGVKVKRQSLWIKDCVACHSEAPARNALILATARKDAASGIPQYIEAFGAYKDAYTTLRDLLRGLCVVRQSRLPGDKSAKLSPLEPIFEAGNVHIMRGDWNHKFIDQFRAFPDGPHDDYCDPCAIIFDAFKARSCVLDPNA